MNPIKKLLTVLISVLFSASFTAALPVRAEPVSEDTLRWRAYETDSGTEGVMITGCTSEAPVWEFPSIIDGKPVLRLETLHSLESDPAYSNTTTKEIIVPEGVEEIDYAFAMYKALEKVTLPQSLKLIGRSSFYHCSSLKEINFPEGLEIVDSNAFEGCSRLETVTLPHSVTKLGEYAFGNCESLKELTLSAGIKQIPPYAFDGCTSLTSVVIPEGVERIGTFSFEDGLKMVTLPASLTYVDMNGFPYDSLEKLLYNGTKQEFGQILSYNDQIGRIKCPVECSDGTINGGPSDGESNSAPIAITVVVIVLAAGGGIAAYFLLKRKKK